MGSTGTCAAVTGVDHGIWYKWTPSVSGVYEIKDCSNATATSGPNGTIADTVMATFFNPLGCAGGNFTENGCDDDTCCGALCGGQSQFQANYVGGVTYYILVYHFTEPTNALETAQVLINKVDPPANDKCNAAQSLTLNTPVDGTTNVLASDDYEVADSCYTTEGQLGNVPSSAPGLDVTYSFRALDEGDYSFRVTSFNGGPDPILYLMDLCESSSGPITISTCHHAANRSNHVVNAAEEAYCAHVTAGQTLFAVVDAVSPPPAPHPCTPPDVCTGPLPPITKFTMEVNRCNLEVEFDGTPVDASPLFCPVEGSIFSFPQFRDIDYFTLGSPAVGSRVFAIADGIAGNPNTATVNFDMRVTTPTDTVQFDDFSNVSLFGTVSPNIAGAPLPGGPAYLQISDAFATKVAEPYRLYSTVRPPGTGLGGSSAAREAAEPNDDTPMLGDYFSGSTQERCSVTTSTTCTTAADCPAGESCTSLNDVDFFSFCARQGDLLMTNVDADPLRNTVPFRAQLSLFDPASTQLYGVSDAHVNFSTTPGTGNLLSQTPSFPAQAIVHRVRTTGLYTAAVNALSSQFGAGNYLWQASLNCLPLSADLEVSKSDSPDPVAAGAVVTYTITVTNHGPNPATLAVLRDSTPAGTSFVSLNPPSGWTCTTPPAGGPGEIVCVSDVTGCFDGTAAFTLAIQVATCAGSSISNTATVSSATADPVRGNNAATATTAVLGGTGCDDGNACTNDVCTPSGCTHSAVGAPEVSNLGVQSDKQTLSWSSAGVGATYDVPRGRTNELPVGGGASETCIASGIATASTVSSAAPPVGAAFWYLVRAHNACGTGGYGSASNGTPRVTSACP